MERQAKLQLVTWPPSTVTPASRVRRPAWCRARRRSTSRGRAGGDPARAVYRAEEAGRTRSSVAERRAEQRLPGSGDTSPRSGRSDRRSGRGPGRALRRDGRRRRTPNEPATLDIGIRLEAAPKQCQVTTCNLAPRVRGERSSSRRANRSGHDGAGRYRGPFPLVAVGVTNWVVFGCLKEKAVLQAVVCLARNDP